MLDNVDNVDNDREHLPEISLPTNIWTILKPLTLTWELKELMYVS